MTKQCGLRVHCTDAIRRFVLFCFTRLALTLSLIPPFFIFAMFFSLCIPHDSKTALYFARLHGHEQTVEVIASASASAKPPTRPLSRLGKDFARYPTSMGVVRRTAPDQGGRRVGSRGEAVWYVYRPMRTHNRGPLRGEEGQHVQESDLVTLYRY